MNNKQLTGFIYWLEEHTELRGVRTPNISPQQKFDKIIELKDEFLSKYPSGSMAGWTGIAPVAKEEPYVKSEDEIYITKLEEAFSAKVDELRALKELVNNLKTA